MQHISVLLRCSMWTYGYFVCNSHSNAAINDHRKCKRVSSRDVQDKAQSDVELHTMLAQIQTLNGVLMVLEVEQNRTRS
jgi:hypothetical protein